MEQAPSLPSAIIAIGVVYAEWHERIDDAISREKAIKEWPRLWKLRMIQEANPNWDELPTS
jgi:putative endonuclease